MSDIVKTSILTSISISVCKHRCQINIEIKSSMFENIDGLAIKSNLFKILNLNLQKIQLLCNIPLAAFKFLIVFLSIFSWVVESLNELIASIRVS